MKKKLVVSSLVLSFMPVLVFAQGIGCNAQTGDLFGILCTIGNLLNAVIPVLVVLGVVYFVWGVITYVISDDEEAKTKGRNRMIYGIIGLAVIVGVWGLVNILGRTFGVGSNQNTTPITLPTVNLQ